MDILAAFRSFIRITELGSLSAVARETGATQPAISRQLAALEDHLGVRLIQRSTRSLTLTEDGRDLLNHARLVVEAVEETEAVIGQRRGSPAGLVRLGCPSVFGRTYIVPHLGDMLARYPGLSVELVVSDNIADMIQEGLDVAIRAGDITDVSLVARRLGTVSTVPVASVAYLERYGEPAHPSELANHQCIVFTRSQHPGEWQLSGPEGPITVHVDGRFRSNHIDSVLAAVMAGQGIALVPLWMMREAVRGGLVRPILLEWQPRQFPISAVYPSRRFLAPRTRAVVDFLVEEFKHDPVLAEPAR